VPSPSFFLLAFFETKVTRRKQEAQGSFSPVHPLFEWPAEALCLQMMLLSSSLTVETFSGRRPSMGQAERIDGGGVF